MSRHYNTCLLLCAILLWCVPVTPVLATSTTKSADKEKLERIENILKLYPGNEQVFLCTTVPKKKYRWNGNITISKVLVDNLKQILNENCIKIVTQ